MRCLLLACKATVLVLFSPTFLWATDAPSLSASFGLEDPLVGVIVKLSDSSRLLPEQLIREFLHTDIVLLGEKHDHEDHHALQTWILQKIIKAGRRPGVVFEMIDEDQQRVVDRYLREETNNAELLGETLAWESRGWPAWKYYQPLAELAMTHGLRIVAGNFSQELMTNIQRFAYFAVPGTRRRQLGIDTSLDKDLFTTMQKDLKSAHCQEPSDRQLMGMVLVQHARDAVMAEHLNRTLTVTDIDSAVLIAGSGHVRTDYGVPAHVRRMAPDATVHALAFIEVEDQHNDPSDYGTLFGAETLPFDFVWFTPRVSNVKVCDDT